MTRIELLERAKPANLWVWVIKFERVEVKDD